MLIKKYDPANLFLKEYNYNEWHENLDDESQEPDDSPQEGNGEGKGLKILTPDKLLTRVPVLIAQINAGNNS